MPAAKTPFDRFAPFLLTLLAWLAVVTGTLTVADAQMASIDQSVWEMVYGLNPNQIQASWLANQLPAGTNPLLPNSELTVSTFSSTTTTVSLTFPTVANKLYTVQTTSSLNPPNWVTIVGVSVVGDGTNKTLTASKSAGTYFHVVVQDQSTANDGVSDWAKSYLGYTAGTSISSQTSYTASTLATALSTQNTVTLTASDPTGSQPQAATPPATNIGVITVSRSGYQLFSTITVPLQVAGTASPGVDYTALPSSVTFPAGVNTIPLNVVPLYNPAQFSTTTVIVTAQAGGGYALGTPSSASVLIYPSVVPAGTGLTGSYYNGSNTTYAPGAPTAANLGEGVCNYSYGSGQAIITYFLAATPPSTAFSVGQLVNLQFTTGGLSGGTYDTNYTITSLTGTQSFHVAVPGSNSSASGTVVITPYNTPAATRVDGPVDLIWNGASPISGVPANSPFTARWTGQVLATFSEPYYFSVRSTQGCKLWVNNQKIIDSWTTLTASVTSSSTSSTNVTVASIPTGMAVGSSILGAQITAINSSTKVLSLSANANATITTATNVSFSTDRISTPITLQSGVFYDIKLEYLSTDPLADEVHLQWYNNDMSEQVIPASNLYPYITGFGAAAAAAVTSPVSVAYVYGTGVPFSYTITGSNGTTSYSASNLPSWLTLTGNTLTGTPPGAGTYQFTVTATNSGGSSTVVVTLTVVDPPGSVTREIWTGLAGANISNIPTSTTPNTTDTSLSTLEDTSTYSNNTGERLRGYFTAPTTGDYFFWVSASNAAELWISDDNQKVNLIRRAYVTGPTGSANRNWTTQTNQQSPWLSLVAGNEYYFEVLHNTGSLGSSSNLSVAWLLDTTGTSTGIAAGSGPAQPSVGGIVPAAELWPWDNPTTTNTAGSIYLANLAPVQTLTVPTTASGGAYLSLNGSTALLHLNYDGLTSGTTWRRVYTGTGNNPTLLFDLDAQDKNYPVSRTADGGYTWSVSNLTPLTSGQAYLMVATVDNPNGEISGNFVLTSGSQTAPAVPSYPTWTNDSGTTAGAARFLNETSFGPNLTDISYITGNSSYSSNAGYGYRAWIENQFNEGPTLSLPNVLAHLTNDPQNPYTDTLFFNAWWKNSVTAPDQLRQRVAFALSEILVTSDNNSGLNGLGNALAGYYDVLLNDAFTNYSQLLNDVSLSPGMGDYLNMQGNTPGNIQTGLHPNENYAREIMQLFSIGLYRLWPDGSLMLDDNGEPIPTYNQSVITGMAAAFTGWTWSQAAQANGRLPTGFGPAVDWIDPMVLVPAQHSLIAKQLLDNVVLPPSPYTSSSTTTTGNPINILTLGASQGNTVTTTVTNAYDLNGLIDFQDALNTITNHANVGPFFCRQLIQRLVESNPSPAYVYRVVRAFNGQYNVDGQTTGVIGDLKDTIRAILLDPEARNSSTAASSTTFGKQREALLQVTAPARAFAPTGIANCSYRQLGGQLILVNTNPGNATTGATPHRLSNGDVVQLDNLVDSSTYPPPSQAYAVGNTTPSYNVLVANSGIATITLSGPGPVYRNGDTVFLQFTSGTLGSTSPYNTIQPYIVSGVGETTVSSAPAATFTVPISTSIGTTSGQAFTPYNFTTTTGATVTSASYTVTTGSGTTCTISSSGHNVNDQIYLIFPPGVGSAVAPASGLYTIQTAAASTFTITPTNSPTAVSSGVTVYWPQYNGGYTVTTSGGNSTVTFQTVGAHDLQVGNNVWINTIVGLSPTALPSGSYQITAVPASNEFSITLNGTTLTTGTESTGGAVTYPSTVAYWSRSGTATLDYGTFSIGQTTTSYLDQSPLNSPTVFNFYYPNYEFPGTLENAGLTTPEFQLTNASSSMTMVNSLSAAILNAGNTYGFTSFISGGGAVVMDLGPYMTSANLSTTAEVQSLVATLGTLLTGGNTFNTASASNATITSYVANTTNFPFSSPPTNQQMSNRVRAIVQLIITSAEFAIQK